MAHRRMLNTSQNFEADSDHGQNHAEHPYMPEARSGASGSSSHIHPVADMTVQGGQVPSQWNPAAMSSYSSLNHSGEYTHLQPHTHGPSHEPLPYQFSAGNSHMIQDNYSQYTSSSSFGGQTAPELDHGFYNQTMDSSSGHKRKSPSNPSLYDRGSTSRYYDAGSSSNLHLPVDPWQEKQNTESYHTPWVYPPPNYNRVNNLSIGNEGTQINVRKRGADEMESNLSRTNLSNNSLHHYLSSRSSDQFNSADIWSQSSNTPREWNGSLVSSAGHGLSPAIDSGFFNHEPSTLNSQNSHPSGSLEIDVGHNDLSSNRLQNAYSSSNQSVRGAQNGYCHRSTPAFRASSINFQPGHIATSDEGLQMVRERYPSRYPHTFSTTRSRNIDRNGRTLILNDRYRSYIDEANFDRFTPVGSVIDYSPFHGSRTPFDQHRDMRLDIDSMSYEELLALEERIGNVNTGLSDALISKCLTESRYCSSDMHQYEETCVICLDEYKNMEDVGTLKICSHYFHVGCIRKWLSVKNSCPICKSSAMDDAEKDK